MMRERLRERGVGTERVVAMRADDRVRHILKNILHIMQCHNNYVNIKCKIKSHFGMIVPANFNDGRCCVSLPGTLYQSPSAY